MSNDQRSFVGRFSDQAGIRGLRCGPGPSAALQQARELDMSSRGQPSDGVWGENDGGGEIGEAEGGKPQLFGSLEGMEKEFL